MAREGRGPSGAGRSPRGAGRAIPKGRDLTAGFFRNFGGTGTVPLAWTLTA